MAAGFFIAYFADRDDQGAAALYVGNGMIVGMDNGGVRYDGGYAVLPDGSLQGQVVMRVGVATQLITGDPLLPGQAPKVSFRLPSNFANGQVIPFTIGGKPVQTRFEKLRDLP